MWSERMKNKVFLLVFGMLGLVLMTSGALAYYSYHYNAPHMAYYYDDFLGEGAFYYSIRPYQYYSGYYIHPYSSYYYAPYYYVGDLYYGDWQEEHQIRRAVEFIDNSYNARYDDVAGRTSGEAFYYGSESTIEPSTNFRNKYAYDYRVDSVDSKDGYYKPEYDSQLGYYNWRY